MSKTRFAMSTKKILLLLVLIVLAYFPAKMGFSKLKGILQLKLMARTFDGDSKGLQSTVILPALDSPMVAGKNNIWCSTFQLAWNELKDTEFKEPIRIEGAQGICDTLNNATQTKNDLMSDSYFVDAGKVSDGVIPRIQAGMKAKFPSEKLPDFGGAPGLVSYSYLEAYISFKKPFKQSEHALSFTDSAGIKTPVKSFGVWGKHDDKLKPVREQVDVLYYKSLDDEWDCEFALDLCKYTEPYQIVVAITEQKESLAKTYESLQQKIHEVRSDSEQGFSKILKSSDVLEVPDMFWKIDHHFAELEDKDILNPGFNDLFVSQALQGIDFRLDRTGVVLKSSAYLRMEKKAAIMPRRFVCDKPFLIYLKKRDAKEPFFMMWVDNAELLRQK